MGTVLILTPDRDFDPTEVAVSWQVLRANGHQVVFATESGALGGGRRHHGQRRERQRAPKGAPLRISMRASTHARQTGDIPVPRRVALIPANRLV